MQNEIRGRIYVVLVIVFVSLQGAPNVALARDALVDWQSTNFQVLRGEGYKLAPARTGTIITLEHANRWQYGDFYGFVDVGLLPDAENTTYAELTPRFSLSQLTGKSVQFGIVNDLYVATQLELGESGVRRYMKGLGADIAVPGFSYFKANVFHRKNPQKPNATWQIYLAFKTQFKIGQLPMTFEGFADLFGEEGGATVPGQLFVPRLLLGVGRWLEQEDNKLQIGLEWQYWHNKFGVDGVTESVPQLQVKYTL